MDDIQIIIYIVFLVLYFLSRGLKGSKKKQPKRPRPNVPPDSKKSPPMTFEDLLQEFTGQKAEKPKPVAEEPSYAEEFESEVPSDDEIDEIYQKSVKEGEEFQSIDEVVTLEPISSKFKVYDEEEIRNPLADELVEMLQDPDDVKKAIVLKEIIDRRY